MFRGIPMGTMGMASAAFDGSSSETTTGDGFVLATSAAQAEVSRDTPTDIAPVAAPEFAAPPEGTLAITVYSPVLPTLFTVARSILEAEAAEEMMLVLNAGQSLSFGTTHSESMETLWPGPVDAERAFMLDFNHQGVSARGWNRLEVDAGRFDGLIPMQSHVTETPAPAMIAQMLAAYDAVGRVAPNMLSVPTGAIGASLLELMTEADALVADVATGLALFGEDEIFAVARSDGKYDYYIAEQGAAVHLNTLRHPPGLWDTMTAQLGFAVQGTRAAGHDLHGSVAMSMIHGQADAGLDHGTYDYAWALTRYLDQIEAELASVSGRDDLELVVTLAQGPGDADANVAFDQLAVIAADPRVHYGGTQWAFQGRFASAPGADHVHLSPEGYAHLGRTVGQNLARAVVGRPEDPILIDAVARETAQTLLVSFAGVEGRLVADSTIFTDMPGLNAPEFYGFRLSQTDGADVVITNAEIIGGDLIRLTLDASISGSYRLSLGHHGQDLSDLLPDRAFESYNGTPLRDSQVAEVSSPNMPNGDNLDVFEFAPIQYHDFWV